MAVYARFALLGGSEPEPVQEPIDIEVWEPNPEKPGYLRFVRMKTVQEVFDELEARLKTDKLLPDEYFTISPEYDRCPEMETPKDWWRIACFAVKGVNEGHYVHIGIIRAGGEYRDLFLGKTFQGLDYALKVAGACTRYFEG